MVVQIVFGLVQNQQFVAMRQQKGQHRGSALPGRGLANGLKVSTIPFAAVLHLQTIFGKPAQNMVGKLGAFVGFGFEEFIEPGAKFPVATTGLRQLLFGTSKRCSNASVAHAPG